MTTTGGTGSMIQCGYCGSWHTYSYEMCKDMHNRPVAPATGGSGVITANYFTQEYIDKLKADHLAALAEKEIEIDHQEQDNLTLQAKVKELEDDLDTAIRMGRDLAGSKDLRIKELEEWLTAQKEGKG
jgi:hypothetical protein